jgi:2-phosphosulfolactate phosphatase
LGVDRATPRPDYDFFNSPTSARAADVAGRPVSLASFNGARTVATLRERGVEDVYVGSTTNAAAVAQRVQDTDGPIHLVCAGSQGSIALEDLVGALLVVRHLRGDEPNLAALAHYHDLLVESRRPLAGLPEIRRRDLADFVTRIDSRSIVPRLDDAGFVDDATDHATPAPSGSGRTASRS